ncbi:MAG: hypothetical protein I8H75_04780 [Myxococcaceae bacterium]|nr:hypothetical protein [Myxococcaceae bacterium]MBH2006639.1 hypothetical protein [Myxococcaceae bacterium]
MATARDTLFEDLQILFQTPRSQNAESSILNLLKRFRVQFKPGSEPSTHTARKSLLDQLKALWEAKQAGDRHRALSKTLDSFRMQVKASSGKKSAAKSFEEMISKKSSSNFRVGQPLAGGPQRRDRIRGECPKCRGMGVVLARSYHGDEYLSCIYCGYQTYRTAMGPEFDLPLAAELLNRRFDDRQEQLA